MAAWAQLIDNFRVMEYNSRSIYPYYGSSEERLDMQSESSKPSIIDGGDRALALLASNELNIAGAKDQALLNFFSQLKNKRLIFWYFHWDKSPNCVISAGVDKEVSNTLHNYKTREL